MLDTNGQNPQTFKEIAELLYVENFRYIYKVVTVLLQDKSIVDDIVQEAFYKAFKSMNQLRDTTKFRSWLASIAVNLCKDYCSKSKREMSVENLNTPVQSSPPEELILAKLSKIELQEILQQLENNEREILLFKYHYEFSTRELAQYYRINIESVNARLFRARKKFKLKFQSLRKES